MCFKVVTDNAANMKCAFTMESEQSADENIFDEADDSTCADDELNLSHHWERLPLTLTHFEGWIGCAAHQVQLVVHDGYKELLNYRRVQAAFKKAKAICTLSRRSSMLLMEGFQFLMRQGGTHTRECMSIFSSMQIISIELWEVVISLLLLLLL